MIKMTIDNLFTKKQQQVLNQELNNRHWKLMINYGAVRAGKTFVDNFVFLYEVKHAAEIARSKKVKYPMYILAGVSSKSIANNILNEIANTFGLTFKFDKHNSFKIKFPGLPAVKIVQTFTGSISGLGAIRGMTSFGAYINEASLANKEVFEEIRSRCSTPGARVVCDTNPDVPTHWLKTDYIDNPKHSSEIISNHFTMDDNTALDPEYVAGQKSTTPSGMFYDRKILGLWVAGEGLVYQDFDKSKNLITRAEFDKRTADQQLTYYCGVDWGYEHDTSIVVLADDNDGNIYLVEEHTGHLEQIMHWVKIAKQVQQDYGYNIPFYCDTARVEHIDKFKENNINAQYAYKSVLKGIEQVAGLIKQHKFMAVQEGIQQFLDEVYQYVWNDKTGEPVKEHDHVMDAIRYAIATRQWNHEYNQPHDNYDQQDQLLADKGLIDYPDDLF